jgi:voltage-gated potassium channel
VPRASGLIACISNDNDNLVITLSARLLAPKIRIVARCADEREQTKIRRAGADAVVLPNMIGGMRMVSEMVRPDVVTFIDEMLRDKERRLRVEEVQLAEGSPLIGTTIGLLHARKIKDFLVVALRRADGTWHYNPEEHEPLTLGMTIIFMGSPAARSRARAPARPLSPAQARARSRPSASSAACTAGRSAMRPTKAARCGQVSSAMPT